MALQTAAEALAASDLTRTVVDVANLTIVSINEEITSKRAEGIYLASFAFDTEMSNNELMIIQGDKSNIALSVVLYALTEAGFKVACKEKSKASSGTKLTLTVAWY